MAKRGRKKKAVKEVGEPVLEKKVEKEDKRLLCSCGKKMTYLRGRDWKCISCGKGLSIMGGKGVVWL